MTREELKEIIIAEKNIKAKKETAIALYDLATSLPSTDFSKPRVQTSKDFANIILNKFLDLEREIQSDIAAVLEKKSEAQKEIRKLKVLERDIMQMRYIGGLNWEHIAATLHVSKRQVYRIHNNAMLKIKDVI